jgi:polyhydroxyalkanoate synthesis regulator phasin
MKGLQRIRISLFALVVVLLAVFVAPVFAQNDGFNPEVAVLPQGLERISWGAIIAGTIVALMVQLTLNLLAIAIGASTLNPADDDSASAADVGKGTAVSMGLIMLAALFVGGWLAARFAGNPERLDGLLHGIIVWGLVTLITLLLLTTTIGRIFSGLGHFVQRSLRLAGDAAQTVTTGVGRVAQDAAHTAQRAASNVAHSAQDAIQSPQGQQLGMQANSAVDRIQREAMDIIQRAGVNQQQVGQSAREAVQDVRNAVAEAVQKPDEINRIVANTIGKLFNRGREVVSQVDRDAVVDLLVQRGNMSREQAEAQVMRWEQQLEDAPRQAGAMMNDARSRAEGAPNAINEQVSRVQNAVSEQVSKVQHDIERTARETAQAPTDVIAKLALIAFVIVMVGAVAAGIGGYFGAPQELPVAEIDTTVMQP